MRFLYVLRSPPSSIIYLYNQFKKNNFYFGVVRFTKTLKELSMGYYKPLNIYKRIPATRDMYLHFNPMYMIKFKDTVRFTPMCYTCNPNNLIRGDKANGRIISIFNDFIYPNEFEVYTTYIVRISDIQAIYFNPNYNHNNYYDDREVFDILHEYGLKLYDIRSLDININGIINSTVAEFLSMFRSNCIIYELKHKRPIKLSIPLFDVFLGMIWDKDNRLIDDYHEVRILYRECNKTITYDMAFMILKKILKRRLEFYGVDDDIDDLTYSAMDEVTYIVSDIEEYSGISIDIY